MSAGIPVAQYRLPLDEMPPVAAPQTGVGVRITLPDGQVMELRANAVVLNFASGELRP